MNRAWSPILFSLLGVTSRGSVVVVQRMQVTGMDNGNDTRNATCAVIKCKLNGVFSDDYGNDKLVTNYCYIKRKTYM